MRPAQHAWRNTSHWAGYRDKNDLAALVISPERRGERQSRRRATTRPDDATNARHTDNQIVAIIFAPMDDSECR